MNMEFSPDGENIVTVGRMGRIRFWNLDGVEIIKRRGTLYGTPAAVAIAPDGRSVAVADEAGNVQVWLRGGGRFDLEDNVPPESINAWPGPQFLAFANDGKSIIGGGNPSSHDLQIWDPTLHKRLLSLPGHTQSIMGVAVSPDGGKIATAARDSTVRVYSKDGELLNVFPNASASVGFFPDGERLAACHAHGKDNGVKIFNLKKGLLEREMHAASETESRSGSPWAYCVAVAPDNLHLASVHRDGIIRIWKADAEKPVREIPLRKVGQQSTHTPGSVAFTRDSSTLIASAGTKSIFLCDVKTGKILTQLDGHRRMVVSFSLTPDGKMLASTGSDFQVIIWDVGEALADVKR
jgi:WD40 repeat protein